ncbi:MAG: AMP-binding protein [Clostridium sp.]|nr:MAG: AMP-binding protein [Clostridium sp.]
MPNTPEEVAMFYAINEIGAVANMIHPLSSEKDIEYYLNKSNSKVMLCIDIAYKKVNNIIDNTSLEKK